MTVLLNSARWPVWKHWRNLNINTLSSYKSPPKTLRRYQCTLIQDKTIRIGCASGFWGDTPTAAFQLVHQGNIDFLVFDYLSEITMSLLAAARKKNPELGYTPDFVHFVMEPLLKDIKNKGIKVVSNAGGINPLSCTAALQSIAEKNGIDLKIATVTGDDLMQKENQLQHKNIINMDAEFSFPSKVHTVNAYLGSRPIASALDEGADVVVTGRCVDSALILGPLIHSFHWQPDEWNKLAQGSLAGHLLECGAQCTGGIFTDWSKVKNWENIGFPIAECSASGEFLITKPPKTGGLVSCGTVSEQLLYEIHDPRNYILPDVVCDFTPVTLEERKDSVLVKGAKGKPPTPNYKVTATYQDGFRSTAVCIVIGPKAAEKAQKTADAVLKRCSKIFQSLKMDNFSKVNIEIIGSGTTYGHLAKPSELATREVVLWMAVHHVNEKALQLFSREIAPAGTGMAPGLTGLVGGRPKSSPVLKHFSFEYPKENITVSIWINGKKVKSLENELKYSFNQKNGQEEIVNHKDDESSKHLLSGSNTYRLEDLAYTRSGDKGNTANIGVIARHYKLLPYIENSLTVKALAAYFQHKFDPDVDPSQIIKCYRLPGIHALNFVLPNSLGGGGIASLRCDPQGKGLGQMLLDYEISNMPLLDDIIS